MVIELHESFTKYGPNKRRNCNWVASHLRITDFYVFYGETNSPWKANHRNKKRNKKLQNFFLAKQTVFITLAYQSAQSPIIEEPWPHCLTDKSCDIKVTSIAHVYLN